MNIRWWKPYDALALGSRNQNNNKEIHNLKTSVKNKNIYKEEELIIVIRFFCNCDVFVEY